MGLFLKKLIPIWAFPPGVVLLLLAALMIAGPWLFRRKARIPAYVLTGLSFLLLWLASIEPVSRRLMSSLENSVPSWDGNLRGAECIVVLGGGTIAGAPDAGGVPVPAGDAFRRVAHAAKIHQRTGLPVVATGGVVFERSNSRAEAEVMKESLSALGVAPSMIFTETRSRDTADNARMTRELLEKRRFGSNVLLVSSAYHMPRSIMLFRRAGLNPIPVPTDYKTDRGPAVRHKWAESILGWMPQASELQRTVSALRERLGLFFYTISNSRR
jgi:uncharacterized SAM-binding protein YcdF (DUF218 family)